MGDYTDTLYCCGTDFLCEKKENTKWFSFIEQLKFKTPCWQECGIVEVIFDYSGNQLFNRWVEKGLSNEPT